jgi:hypothetical protein
MFKATARSLMDIDKIIDIVRTLKEEGMIANAVGAPPAEGQPAKIAGIHGDPPVRKKKRYIYAGKGSRKQWMA